MRERGFVGGQGAEGQEYFEFDIPSDPDGDAQLLEALAECQDQEVQVLPAPAPLARRS